MQLTAGQEGEVKTWMVKKLEAISDADPEILTEYCLAIWKSDSSDEEIRKSAIENLEDFLKDHTVGFVDEVFAKYAPKARPSIAASSVRLAPTAATGQHASPALAVHSDEWAVVSDQRASARLNAGRKRSYRDANNYKQDTHYATGTASKPLRPRRTSNTGRARRQVSSHLPSPPNDMSSIFGSGLLPPTPPPGFPAFDPANPMAAYAFMQTMFPQVAAMLPSSPNDPVPTFGSNLRCRDYDTKGYCTRGSSCPFEHGDDRIIAPHSDEYDPTRANFNMHVTHDRARRPNHSTVPVKRWVGSAGHDRARRSDRAAFSNRQLPADQVSNTIVVERIPREYVKEDLVRKFFSQFGRILEVNINPLKQLAVVKYDQHAEAKRAWHSPKVVFDNRFVKVYWYRPGMETGDGTAERTVSAKNVHAPFDTASADDYAFQQQQEEKQRAYEERMRTSRAMEEARQDIVSRRDKMAREREELVSKLVATKTQDADGSDARTSNRASDSKDLDAPDPKIKALRNQLAQMKAEAKTLGIDPDAPYDGPGHAPSSYHRGLGPSIRRGAGSYRGRGSLRGHHQGYGFVRGRDSSVRKLDNRPKNIAISGVEFDVGKDESLRSYLTLLGPFEALAPNPQREDSRIVVFQERWQAEQVMHGKRDMPGVGKVELSWVATDPANGAADQSANGLEDDMSLDVQGDVNKVLNDEDPQQPPVEEVDLDVAGGDDDWAQIS